MAIPEVADLFALREFLVRHYEGSDKRFKKGIFGDSKYLFTWVREEEFFLRRSNGLFRFYDLAKFEYSYHMDGSSITLYGRDRNITSQTDEDQSLFQGMVRLLLDRPYGELVSNLPRSTASEI